MFELLLPEERKLYKKALASLKHLALICDGDRRWAKKHGLHPSEGHKENFLVTTPRLVEFLFNEGLAAVSYICITTENFKRSEAEVIWMLEYIEGFLEIFLPFAKNKEIKIVHMGKLERIPESLKQAIINAEAETKHFSSRAFYIGIDYGGRDEICRAVRKIVSSGHKGDVTEELVQQYLDTSGNIHPHPDFWIRCGGEQRLSGCLLWSVSYSEFYFIKEFYPEVTVDHLVMALVEYGRRGRTLGFMEQSDLNKPKPVENVYEIHSL